MSSDSMSVSSNSSPARSVAKETRSRSSSGEPEQHRKKIDVSLIKKWLEAKQRRYTDKEEDMVSIVTSGDENPPSDDPGDGAYRGRVPVRSRIGTVQAVREAVSPIRPRRSGRFGASASNVEVLQEETKAAEDDGEIVQTPSKSKKNRLKQHKHKSSAIVDSESDDLHTGAHLSSSTKRRRMDRKASSSPLSKKARYATGIRTPSPVFRNGTKSDDERNYLLRFFDDEASADDHDGAESDGDEDQAMQSDNEYDYADSFIDDGIAERHPSDSDVSMQSRRPSLSHSHDGISDASNDPAVLRALKALKEAKAARAAKKASSGLDASGKKPKEKDAAKRMKEEERAKRANEDALRKKVKKDEEAARKANKEAAKRAEEEAKVLARLKVKSFAKKAKGDKDAAGSEKEARTLAKKVKEAKDAQRAMEAGKKLMEAARRVREDEERILALSRLSTDSEVGKASNSDSPTPLRSPVSLKDGPSRQKTAPSSHDSDIEIISSNIPPKEPKSLKSKLKIALKNKMNSPKTKAKTPSKAKTLSKVNAPSKSKKGQATESTSDGDENDPSTPSKEQRPPKTPRSDAKTPAAPPASEKKKGKQKAVARTTSPEPPVDDNDAPYSDGGLSAYELEQIEKAIAASKAKNFPKAGESSSQGSASSTGPVTPSRPGRGVSMKDFLKLLNPVSDTKQASPKKPQEPSSPVQVPTTSGPFDPKADPSVVRRCVTLPDVDEVNDPALQDPILAEQYVDLPRLRRGILIPWTDTPGKGFISFTKWAEWIPDMNAANAYGAVNFTQAGPIRNPARVSPLDVAMKNMGSNSQKFNFYCATNPPVPLIATSAGWVDRSQLLAPAEKGVRQKYISIILHSQEWQRTLGFIRTASGFTSLHGQLARNALQFSSRAQASRRTTAPAVPDADGTTREVPANMFVNDPTQNSASSSTVATDTFSLPNDATIPVYDARDAGELDFEKVLPRLSDELPLYTGGEIPFGSFVLLGYTMTIFLANNNNWTLGCNILWVVLIGSP